MSMVHALALAVFAVGAASPALAQLEACARCVGIGAERHVNEYAHDLTVANHCPGTVKVFVLRQGDEKALAHVVFKRETKTYRCNGSVRGLCRPIVSAAIECTYDADGSPGAVAPGVGGGRAKFPIRVARTPPPHFTEAELLDRQRDCLTRSMRYTSACGALGSLKPQCEAQTRAGHQQCYQTGHFKEPALLVSARERPAAAPALERRPAAAPPAAPAVRVNAECSDPAFRQSSTAMCFRVHCSGKDARSCEKWCDGMLAKCSRSYLN